jgi:hypothetical protein
LEVAPPRATRHAIVNPSVLKLPQSADVNIPHRTDRVAAFSAALMADELAFLSGRTGLRGGPLTYPSDHYFSQSLTIDCEMRSRFLLVSFKADAIGTLALTWNCLPDTTGLKGCETQYVGHHHPAERRGDK